VSRAPATVVLCSRDRPDQLAAALPGVRAALGPEDRAVVVDSASSTPATREVAEAAGFEVVRAHRPGLSHARNVGVAHAATPVVAFTDDDCSPDPGWLDAIGAHFADPAVGFVTGRVGSTAEGGSGNSVLDRAAPERYRAPRDPAGIGHGANMAFRVRALEQAGAFDEQLGAGGPLRSGEDADMLYRVLAAGWHGVYEPGALVTHDQWRDAKATLRLRHGYGLGNGAYRAKILRGAGRRGLRLILRPVLRDSVESLYWAVRARSPERIARELAWTSGFCIGLVRALRAPMDGPNLA
jgi:cellulose synthase/poly-beta-1,6-N-acetylglucosamine synthase-like glycosyltransferase